MSTNTPTEPRTKSSESGTSADPKKQPEPKSKTDWNILFYLIGDGLISASMVSQLKAITDAGFEEHTNVLVYFDPNCNGKNARIFDVNARRKEECFQETGHKTVIGDGKNSFVRDIAEDFHVPCLPQIPAEITLRYFLEYARTYYPAKNYILFLMGHGVIVGNDAFLPDPDDNSAITLSDLGWILRTFGENVRAEGDEFELLGFHSCSMSSVELLYELAGSARYMIGTQGAAFPGSWPYRQLLKKIFVAIDGENGAANGSAADGKSSEKQDLSSRIRNSLQSLSFYSSEDFWLAGFSSDISMCSLNPNHVNGLREPIENLSELLQEALDHTDAKNCIRLAHLESQSYWGENYTDLFDFCSRLWNRCRRGDGIYGEIQKACEDVTLALNCRLPEDDQLSSTNCRPGRASTGARQIIMHSDYYGPAYQWSNGLSIYFPWRSPTDKVIESYRGYKFTREHGSKSWWSFLHRYFRTTQRAARQTKPMLSTPELPNPIPWRSQTSLLRTLSVERLLSLGPPPAGFPTKREFKNDRSDKAGDLTKVGGALKKIAEDLANVGVDLSKVGGDLANKVGGDLSKVGGDLADKVGGDLAKLEADLSKVLGNLSKVGGDLSKVGGDLSSSKVGGDLSKVGGDLSKVGGDLSKVGGDLAGKVGGDLSKVGGDLAGKVGGDLSKVGGDLGGLYGHTVIKNFASPENGFITSRPGRNEKQSFAEQTGKRTRSSKV